MKKGWIMGIFVLVVVLLVFYLTFFNNNFSKSSIENNSENSSNQFVKYDTCVPAGEVYSNPSLGPEGDFGTCCEGLVSIGQGYYYDPSYPGADENGCALLIGAGLLCSDCGNGICENWENKCNCPGDCS